MIHTRLIWKLDTDLCPRNECNGVRGVCQTFKYFDPLCFPAITCFTATFSKHPRNSQMCEGFFCRPFFWARAKWAANSAIFGIEVNRFESLMILGFMDPIKSICFLLRWLISIGNFQWFLGPFHSSIPSDRCAVPSNSLHFQGAVPPSQALPVESRETCCVRTVVDMSLT